MDTIDLNDELIKPLNELFTISPRIRFVIIKSSLTILYDDIKIVLQDRTAIIEFCEKINIYKNLFLDLELEKLREEREDNVKTNSGAY